MNIKFLRVLTVILPLLISNSAFANLWMNFYNWTTKSELWVKFTPTYECGGAHLASGDNPIYHGGYVATWYGTLDSGQTCGNIQVCADGNQCDGSTQYCNFDYYGSETGNRNQVNFDGCTSALAAGTLKTDSNTFTINVSNYFNF